MARIFIDAVQYIAVLVPADDLHDVALKMAEQLSGTEYVTTDAVLTEVLAYVAERGASARAAGVGLVDAVRVDERTLVIRQTPELFDRGLELYRRRLDKGYSLTDCISFLICQEFEITDVMTHDAHFEQEGFSVLL